MLNNIFKKVFLFLLLIYFAFFNLLFIIQNAQAKNSESTISQLEKKEFIENDVDFKELNKEDINNKEQKTPDKKNKIKEEVDYSDYKIRINEILPNPNGTEYGKEFIEIYNYGDEDIDLVGWKIEDASGNTKDLDLVQSKSYLVIYMSRFINNDKETLKLIPPDSNNHFQEISFDKELSTGKSLNFDKEGWYEETPTPGEKNTENPANKDYSKYNVRINEILPSPNGTEYEKEFIEIYNEDKVNLSGWKLRDENAQEKNCSSGCGEFVFGNNENLYVLKDSDELTFSINDSNETIYLVAPNNDIFQKIHFDKKLSIGKSFNFDENKWYEATPTPEEKNLENPLTKNYPNLILSEILPNPIGDETTGEFIEIYNPNDFEINLENWVLKDSSANGSYLFNENQTIFAKSYFIIYRTDFDFALNNSGGEEIYLVSPNQKIQSQTKYQSAKENLSYNFDLDNDTWRWSKFLTPNAKNIFNNLPEIEKFSFNKKVYRDVYANFEVKASDLDNDELKFTWDFGDGHKSYKTETSHKYLETGTYQASLKIFDGSEEVVRNFEIKVKKYPKYDLEIVKIVPNPKGLDSLNEYIVIKNKSGEKVNLEGWSIATGSDKDKIYNHPVRESLMIKNGKEEIVTRKYSAFSLPNKKGYIELRQPDGKVVSKVSYEKDKIQNDESYEKIGKEWQWISSEESGLNDPKVQEIIAQALANEKKWQIEIFEQKIAKKIVNKKIEDKNSSEIKNVFWLSDFSEKINLFLSRKLPELNNFLANVFKESYLAWLKNKVIVFNENRNFVLSRNFLEIEKLV